MRKFMTYLASMLMAMTMLTGCVVLPLWDDGYYGDGGRHHGYHGHYDRRR